MGKAMFPAVKHLQAAFRLHNEIAYEYVRADLSKKEGRHSVR
jgi:hypothetical protein